MQNNRYIPFHSGNFLTLKKVFFLFLTIVLGQILIAQPVLSDFYPTLKKTKFFQFNYKACFSGDCKEGSGIFGSIHNNWPFTYNPPYSDITLFSGTFSNQGAQFQGKIYQLRLEYEKEEYEKYKFILIPPIENLDLTNMEALREYLVYEGSAISKTNEYTKEILDYIPFGKGEDPYVSYAQDSITRFIGQFNEYPYWAKLEFNENRTFKSFEGYVKFYNEILAGKMVYANGSTYEGFFLNNKPHGPGILKEAGNKITSGMWHWGKLYEKHPISFSENMFHPPDSLNRERINYAVGGKVYQGFVQGETNGGNTKLIWSPKHIFYGTLKELTAEGTAIFYSVNYPKRYTFNSWSRGDEAIEEGKFEGGLLKNGSAGFRTIVHQITRPSYHFFPGNSFEIASGTITVGEFINQDQSTCYKTFYTHPKEEIMVSRARSSTTKKGWEVRIDEDGKVMDAWYVYPVGNGIGFLANKEDLSEIEISNALADTEACLPVPPKVKNDYAEYLRDVIKRREQAKIISKELDSIQKAQGKILTAQDIDDKLCNIIKGRVPTERLRVTTNLEEAMILDYDCLRKKYIVAIRKSSKVFNNKYAPHKYIKIELMDYNLVMKMDGKQNFYKICPSCNGYPAGEQVYSKNTWTWTPVLGITWAVQTNKTEVGTQVVICNRCKGEAWIRK